MTLVRGGPSGGGGASMTPTNHSGSDFSGSDGDSGRTMATDEPTLVLVDNQLLHPTVDYAYAVGLLTLINRLWDNQSVTIWA